LKGASVGKEFQIKAQKFFENICVPGCITICATCRGGIPKILGTICLLQSKQWLTTQSPGVRLSDLPGEGQFVLM